MADDWPGVVAAGNGWRVIVARDAARYRLQQRGSGKDKRWGPVYGPSAPSKWGAAFGASFSGLSEAVECLPLDPQDAVCALAAAQGVVVPEAQRVTEWLEPYYSGVLASDANMRAVRDRTGTRYAIQWISPGDHEAGKPVRWITQAAAAAWPEVVDLMARKTFAPGDAVQDHDEIRVRLSALFDGLPEFAADGPWPVVKVLSAAPCRQKR